MDIVLLQDVDARDADSFAGRLASKQTKGSLIGFEVAIAL